jgi:DNA-binding XRE family transcriptional regulator
MNLPVSRILLLRSLTSVAINSPVSVLWMYRNGPSDRTSNFCMVAPWLKICVEQPASDDAGGDAEAKKWGKEFKSFHTGHCTQRVHGVKPILTNLCIKCTCKIMHLDRYMKITGLDDEQVAKRIGVSRVTISRIRRRKVRPDWPTIQQLRKLSRGAITASDFEELNS